jgi:hypothetical protein
VLCFGYKLSNAMIHLHLVITLKPLVYAVEYKGPLPPVFENLILQKARPGGYGRTFDENEEHDAFYLAAATLLPESVISKAVKEKANVVQLANDYGTSPELVEYRIKRLGLWREYKGKSIRLEMP